MRATLHYNATVICPTKQLKLRFLGILLGQTGIPAGLVMHIFDGFVELMLEFE